jgi:hypothetical protein
MVHNQSIRYLRRLWGVGLQWHVVRRTLAASLCVLRVAYRVMRSSSCPAAA